MTAYLQSQLEVELDELLHAEVTREMVARATQPIYDWLDKEIGDRLDVLETGSGLGPLARSLSLASDRNWVQLDNNPLCLEKARELNPTGSFKEGYVHELPFPDNSFDAVGGINIYSIVLDPEEAIKEAFRVLRPGGLFFHLIDSYPPLDVVKSVLQEMKAPSFLRPRNFNGVDIPEFVYIITNDNNLAAYRASDLPHPEAVKEHGTITTGKLLMHTVIHSILSQQPVDRLALDLVRNSFVGPRTDSHSSTQLKIIHLGADPNYPPPSEDSNLLGLQENVGKPGFILEQVSFAYNLAIKA